MRKQLALGMLFAITIPVMHVFATENTELLDEVQKINTVGIQASDLEFQSFSSCEDMSKTLTDFVKENFDQRRGGPMPYGRGGGMVDDMVIMADTDMAEVTNESSKSVGAPAPTVSQGTDFSTTNNQIAGVDEPEVLKSDGDYLYYYNQRLQKVFIINSPLNRSTKIVDMSTPRLVSIIALPSTFSQVQLFVRSNQLVMLAQRRSERQQAGLLDTSSKTEIITYDTTNKQNPKLTKFADLDGWYQDARIVGDTLYVISQVGINRGWYGQTYASEDAVKVDAEALLPKVIDISYTKDAAKKNLKIKDTVYPYEVSVQRPTCAETMYVLPTQESIKQYGLSPQFTLVRAVDLSSPDTQIVTTTTFGSTQTIHLNEKSLYLTNSFWAPYNSACPVNARCIWGGGGDQQTLLHKLALQGTKISYVNSALLPGSPLTQWSMDEDAQGNFRILTSTRSPQQATHLITLDAKMNTLGNLLNIEPGEQFKASRFMGDKLYLVTFEQIDPLFVIDLADAASPKIVGELKIPGFSTYLHPYAPESNGVQWLLGLGYDTTTNQRGGTQTNGVKVDLYKIDYNKKDEKGNIAVTQEVTKTFGEKGSESEALQNPRLFVWNATTRQLILPMILQSATTNKQCNVIYDAEGKVAHQECRDNETYTTNFAGMKAIEVLPTAITERASYDYSDLLKQDKQAYDSYQGQIWPWQLSNLQFRSGYLGDVLYTINNLFVHFVVPTQVGQEVYLPLDTSISVK